MLRTKKIFYICLYLTLLLLSFTSCSSIQNSQKEMTERLTILQSRLDTFENTVQETTAQNNDISVTIHHILIEPDQILLDYTISGSNNDMVRTTFFDFSTSTKNSTNTSNIGLTAIESNSGQELTIHNIVVSKNESDIFDESDIGKTLSLRFASGSTQMSPLFLELEIADIYYPAKTKFHQEIPYNDGTFTLLNVTQHTCYNEVVVDMDTELTSFIFPCLYDSKGNVADMLGGEGEHPSIFWYMPVIYDFDRIQIQVVQAQPDGSYQPLGEKVEIPLQSFEQ